MLSLFTRRWLAKVQIAPCLPSKRFFSANPSSLSSKNTTSNTDPFDADFDDLDYEKEEQDERNMKRKLLDASLRYVPTYGWTNAAIVGGLGDLGLSPASVGIFEGGPVGLVVEYIRFNNEMLEKKAPQMKITGSVRDKYFELIKHRLLMQDNFRDNWAQGLGHILSPCQAPLAASLLLETADSICYSAGDRSNDMSWYTNRLHVSGAYASTELYMMTDPSEDRIETWKFLSRRLDERLMATEDLNQILMNIDPATRVIKSIMNSVIHASKSQ